jgi:ribosomal protein S27AE
VTVASLHRTLDQELVAILRRASLECPVCGEFLLHRADGIGCPQCGLELGGRAVELGRGLELEAEGGSVGRETGRSTL